jgi:hypothetical protein
MAAADALDAQTTVRSDRDSALPAFRNKKAKAGNDEQSP